MDPQNECFTFVLCVCLFEFLFPCGFIPFQISSNHIFPVAYLDGWMPSFGLVVYFCASFVFTFQIPCIDSVVFNVSIVIVSPHPRLISSPCLGMFQL